VNISGKGHIHGTVRDHYQRPLVGGAVAVYEVGLRSEKLLGKATTNDSASYEVVYDRAPLDANAKPTSAAPSDRRAPDIVVKVVGKDGTTLGTSQMYFNAAADLQVDIDLSGRGWRGPSELDAMLAAVKPFLGELQLPQLTEDNQHQEVSFLTSKTAIARTDVEALAIAARLETQTKIELAAWYGLIRLGPSAHPIGQAAATDALADLPSRATQIFGALMRENIDSLMAGIQGAIDANTIPYAVTADLPWIRKSLLEQHQQYLKSHPIASQSPQLSMKANLSPANVQGRGADMLTRAQFAPVEVVERLPSLAALSGGQQQLMSLSGDGYLSLVQFDGPTSGYFERTEDADWEPFMPFQSMPAIDWKNPNLRFETLDRISRNRFVTRYSSHHGYYDGVEREFRGFARVDQYDTADFATLTTSNLLPLPTNEDAASNLPPVLTKTWFHTGFFFDESEISTQLQSEYYTEGDPTSGVPELMPAETQVLLLGDTVFPTTVLFPDATRIPYDPSDEKMREACRALRGSMLLQVVHAFDGSAATAEHQLAASGMVDERTAAAIVAALSAATTSGAAGSERAPTSVKPLAPEFQRFAADGGQVRQFFHTYTDVSLSILQ
jgi:hypothetical protein